MVYSEIWEKQEKEKDNIQTFFFNHEIVTTPMILDKTEIDKELLINRKQNITIAESKNTAISNHRIRERDLKNFFIKREYKILKLLKKRKES